MISFMPRCLWQLPRSCLHSCEATLFRLHMRDQHTASRAQNQLRGRVGPADAAGEPCAGGSAQEADSSDASGTSLFPLS